MTDMTMANFSLGDNILLDRGKNGDSQSQFEVQIVNVGLVFDSLFLRLQTKEQT